MRLASKGRNSFREEQAFRLLRLRKRIRQRLRYPRGVDKTVVCIAGCQRSGTSLLSHVFRLDPDAVTYDEVSPLSTQDKVQHLRLNPLPEVAARVLADRAPLVVLKPLVESQNLAQVLDLFPTGRAIWMYRHFRDVVASSVHFFSPAVGRQDLDPILQGDGRSWKAEHLAPEVIQRIRALAGPDAGPHDAAALFWLARNSLFFSRGLARDPRVRLCDYDLLVTHPAAEVRRLYDFIGRPYPGDRVLGDIFTGSRGGGARVDLSPQVATACQELFDDLQAAAAGAPC